MYTEIIPVISILRCRIFTEVDSNTGLKVGAVSEFPAGCS